MTVNLHAPLALRATMGIIFLAHGWPKLFGRTEAITVAFTKYGLLWPYLLVIVVGAVEIVGGAALLVGLWTRAAAALLGTVMVGAILFVKARAGLVGGYELDLLLLAGAVTLALMGPGAFALKTEQ